MKRRPPPKRRSATAKSVVNIQEAKTNLSALVDRAAQGEEIVIAKAGRPRARLVALPARAHRKPGGWEGKVWISPDFDDPLPPEIEDAFAGKTD